MGAKRCPYVDDAAGGARASGMVVASAAESADVKCGGGGDEGAHAHRYETRGLQGGYNGQPARTPKRRKIVF